MKNVLKKGPVISDRTINWYLVGLMFIAALTHFIFLTYPSEVVFDEYHYGKYASAYLSGAPSFSGHPPLGEMMLAAAGWAFNIEPNCTFEEIGHPCSPYIFFALRFLPAFFGVLSVIVFYAFIKILTDSKKIALIGAFLFTFENALLVQSRLILIDIFLIFFGLLALYLFLKASKEKQSKKKWLFFILSGLSLGACLSVKWTGLGLAATVFFLMMMQIAKSKINLKMFFKIGVILGACILFVYLLTFWLQFSLTPGEGENSFWRKNFRFSASEFRGEGFQELSFVQKVARMNYKMFLSQESIDASHPANSRFYEWPLMIQAVGYWDKTIEQNNTNLAISLIGNPVIWFLSSFGMLMLIFCLFFKRLRAEFSLSPFILFFIFVGYALNLLPFILISRSTFLYHYFPAYILAIINLAIILNWVNKYNKKLFWVMIILVIAGFLVSAPTTYGFPRYFNTPIFPAENWWL